MDWILIEDLKPSKDHIIKETQFLLKGRYRIGNKESKIKYHVSTLCKYLPEDWKEVYFDVPNRYEPTHWLIID